MTSQTQNNTETFQNLSQESYLPIAVNAFLMDCKVRNLSAGTLKFYRAKLDGFMTFCESQAITQITQLTPQNIREYLIALDQAGHNPGGIHGYYRTLKTFLRWWENEFEPEGWKNPINKVRAPHLPTEPLEPLAMAEFDLLIATCGKNRNGARDRAIMLTLLDSGVRAAELCGLDLADIDIIGGELLIRQGKGRKPRTVFVGNKTRRAIRHWLKYRGDSTGALFTTQEGGHLAVTGLREIIRRRARAAGVPMPGLHDFRRAFCLSQLQAGVPETTIARLMGHATTQLIARYARQTGSDLQSHYKSPVDHKL